MNTFTPNTKIKSAELNSNFVDLASGAGDDTGNKLSYLRKYDFTSHVFTGLTMPTSANLSSTIAIGEAIVNGKYVNPTTTAHTFTASKDTYVFLSDLGAFDYQETTNGGTAPSTPTNVDGTNKLLIMIAITSGAAITTVTQLGFDTANRMIYSSKKLPAVMMGTTVGYANAADWQNASSNTVQFMFVVPSDYISGDLKFRITSRGGGAGNIRWQRNVFRFRIGSAFSQIDTNVTTTEVSTTNVTNEYTSTLAAANFRIGDTIRIDLARLGADGADTYNNDVDCDGAWLEYNGRFN